MQMSRSLSVIGALLVGSAAWLLLGTAARSAEPEKAAGGTAEREFLYSPEGNRLRVIDLSQAHQRPVAAPVLIESAAQDPGSGRDINGMVCAFPDGSGRFVAGEDTGQPDRPAGWGVFSPRGRQIGKLVAQAGSSVPEPYGCAFDATGRLWTTEVGDPGFGSANGQLILWFPPYTGSGPARYCKLAGDIGTAGGLAFDDQGRAYVASSSGREILRFSPPFPTGPDAAGGCGAQDAYGDPMAETVQRERFVGAHWWKGLITYSGLAFAPNGNLYAASVFTGRIGEFSPEGELVRMVVEPESWIPPHATGTPQGLAVDSNGNLYYADLDIVWEEWMPGPGSNGRVWRVRMGPSGEPSEPEVLLEGLAFPDGLGIVSGRAEGP